MQYINNINIFNTFVQQKKLSILPTDYIKCQQIGHECQEI